MGYRRCHGESRTVLDERYERFVWPRQVPTLRTEPKEIEARARANRQNAGRRGLVVCSPTRYADDFIVLVSAPPSPDQYERAREAAVREKAELATFLKDRLGLELSDAKTKVTPVTETLRFLGHHVRVRWHSGKRRAVCTAVIPKDSSQRLRTLIKRNFGRNTFRKSLAAQLQNINRVTQGWGQFYRHAWGAKTVFSSLDSYIWHTILRWLRKKHRRISVRQLKARYGWHKPGGTLRWRDGTTVPFEIARLKVEPFRLAWLSPPDYRVNICGEPGA